MKRIVTALGINSLNSRLKEKEDIEVIGNDIPYQDGVLDILKGNSEINLLIVHESLVGEYEIKEFINKILEINNELEIVFFMEYENTRLRNFLEKKGISKIFIDGELGINEIIDRILRKNTNLNIEVEKLKNIINTEKINIEKNSKKFKTGMVVAISGCYGSGKSLITSLLGEAAKKIKLKTIIIDFDIINNSINSIFKIKKYNYYSDNIKIENFITPISNNLDVFCGIDSLFTEKNKISYEKVENLISELKDIYDLILIDTSSETVLKFIKIVLANVDKIIFLVEPNLLEIKKAENLLEIYIEDWEVYPNKIQILFNKVNSSSIDEEILKEIFGKFKILGKLKFSSKFTEFANNIKGENLLVNKFMKILMKMEKVG